jgi:hypothetical protein
MGFLDKLLGRSKDVADTAGDKAMEYGDKAVDVAGDAGDKAAEVFGEAKSQVTGDGDEGVSETTEAEQRLDDVRDQAMQDEGRIP